MLNIKLIESINPQKENRIYLKEHKPSFSHIKQKANKINGLQLVSSNNTLGANNRSHQYHSQDHLQLQSQRQTGHQCERFIDFSKEVSIDQREYDAALMQSNDYFENFKNEYIDEICHINTLSSSQRHLMEFVSYIIGYEYFDWNYIRNQLLFDMKSKLMLVSYDGLSLTKINQLLNRLLVDDEFPYFIPPYSIDYLYKWAKCQIMMIIHKFQHKESHTNAISNENDVLRVNQETQTVTTNHRIKVSVRNKEMLTIPRANKKRLNPIHLKRIKRIQIKQTQGQTQGQGQGQSGSLSISSLPKINHFSKRKNTDCVVNKKALELKGYDYLKEKFIKENKEIQFLPLLNNRSINQMKKIYYSESDAYYKQRKDFQLSYDLRQNSLRIMNKNRLIRLLASNRSIALNSLSNEKLLELISES